VLQKVQENKNISSTQCNTANLDRTHLEEWHCNGHGT